MAPPALGLGLRLSAPLTLSGLDPDAKAYIAAVETALSSSITADQKNAINDFFKTGKSAGWYSSIKRLYLPIWADAAANAIDMVTRTSGTFSASGVTHASGYIQGNGSSGYFDPGTSGNLQTLGMSGDNLHYMLGVILGGTTGSVPIGAWDGNADRRCQITDELSPTSLNRFANPANLVTSTAANNDTDRTGILIGCSLAFDSRYLLRRKLAGTTIGANSANEVRTIPNAQPFILARNNTGTPSLFYDGQVFAAGYGLKISQSDAGLYSSAIKDLWETASGLTLEGAEYISALRSAGATVTTTQESAIHNFIKTGKQQGWYSSIKRLYLPIWADAAANAIDMISLTSGTFPVGGVDQSNVGYIQGDGATGYFDMGVGMATLGMTSGSCSLFSLAIESDTRNQAADHLGTISGAPGQTLGESLGNAAFARITNTGTTLLGAINQSTGILSMVAESDSSRSFRRRTSSGVTSLATSNGEAAFSLVNSNVFGLARNFTSRNYSDAKIGMLGLGLGMSDATTDAFTLALKDLWENASGLSLDPDAAAYINAVEAADGQSLEIGVRAAYSNFIKGCKDDGIWDAIKASCILAGARTLSGALVPLKGTAPTNNNFVSGDYNRETGLKGDGTTKYLDSNRNNNADPQNDQHLSGYRTVLPTDLSASALIGAGSSAFTGSTRIAQSSATSRRAVLRNRNTSFNNVDNGIALGFTGMSRSSSVNFNFRYSGTTDTITQASETPYNANLTVFVSNNDTVTLSAERIAFYSIGEALDLAALDSRVSTLIDRLHFSITTGEDWRNYDPDAVAYIVKLFNSGVTYA